MNNSITFKKDEVKFCHKNNCISVKGTVVKTLVFTVAAIVVVSGLASLLETSK